jgi:hypothetical protein
VFPDDFPTEFRDTAPSRGGWVRVGSQLRGNL